MDIATLVVSAVVAAGVGSLASVASSARISQGTERGRLREEARQRLLAQVRAYRASVSGRTGLLAVNRRHGADSPLTEEAGVRFAEQIERDLPYVTPRLASQMREHLGRLIGPADAAIARDVAFIPEEQRHHQWKADAFLRIKDQVPSQVILNKGLIKPTQMYGALPSAGEAVVEELRSMETTVLASGSRWGRARHTKATTPREVR